MNRESTALTGRDPAEHGVRVYGYARANAYSEAIPIEEQRSVPLVSLEAPEAMIEQLEPDQPIDFTAWARNELIAAEACGPEY